MNSRGEMIPKKVFPCAQCGKLLTSGIKLRSHVEVVHQGQRNYTCTYCQKRFTSKSNLQIHEGSQHTGVLPYHCSFCDKAGLTNILWKIPLRRLKNH
jgi:KRAB domain-containing zinc finger protein